MSDKQVLAAFLAATVAIAAGSAWAASEPSSGSPPAASAAQKDFGKLSADGARGYQDIVLARLAIYDGKVDQAKTFAKGAEDAFAKAKSDNTAFTKAENELMTSQQVAAKTGKAAPGASKMEAEPSAAKADAVKNDAAKSDKVAWLPVDGAMSLNEDYTINPAKAKAVADANKSLAKGDRKAAMDTLKLAAVDTSVVLEVVPLEATINDVHQAAQMIDSGKYYEGSQMLRNVQMAARYDVTDIVGTPKPATTSQSGKDAPAANKDAPQATH